MSFSKFGQKRHSVVSSGSFSSSSSTSVLVSMGVVWGVASVLGFSRCFVGLSVIFGGHFFVLARFLVTLERFSVGKKLVAYLAVLRTAWNLHHVRLLLSELTLSPGTQRLSPREVQPPSF